LPTLKQAPETWLEVKVGVPQLSVMRGAVQRAVVQVSNVVMFKTIFDGHLVITGFAVSPAQGALLLTVTLNVQVVVLFFVSFPVKVTAVVPILKHVPELWLAVKVGVPQLSVMVGFAHVAMAQVSAVAKTIFVGQFRKTGLTVSPSHK
jgi:hypothetical protein